MEVKCMVVDDDPLARKLVKHYIEKTEFLTLSYELANPIEAKNILVKEDADVDLLFLDIQMPEMSGLELMESLDKSYQIVFITSEEQYAVQAFENSVVDYLVKPFEYPRFLKVATKGKENIETLRRFVEKQTHVFVKCDGRLVRIQLSDLLFVEALADYVIFNTKKGKYIVHYTMKGIEKRLPTTSFARVHRSYIINIDNVDHLEESNIMIGDKSVPVGASYKEKFIKKLNML
ncbi:MAG: LytR/AlgR family response regulator transcription factor [Imperialibacter sp.]|uniref:LytR/AlgR family response regulator transcription factor n=1 Tax=Imperialibacter sp. TaxID=2038411 RepID=UPI003A891BFC